MKTIHRPDGPAALTPSEQRKQPMPTTNKNLRVLVVDDNRDGADALGLLLEELGNQVHVTFGGTPALSVATEFRPDVMLIDLVMPDMDGCGLAERFRQVPAFAQTRIVAITGQKDDERKLSALKAGCDAVLFKPVSLKDVKAVLASVVVSDAGRATVWKIDGPGKGKGSDQAGAEATA